MVVPFLHADPHFHSLLHEARGHDNGVRLPCHRCGDLLNRHLDQMSIRARVVESIGFTYHDGLACGDYEVELLVGGTFFRSEMGT
jgi:hypothetical protein